MKVATLDVQELLMNVAMKTAVFDRERNLCNDWVWLKMNGKHS